MTNHPDTTTSELVEPCPFCRSANVSLRELERRGSEARWHRVECEDCGAHGPEIQGCSLNYFGAARIAKVAQEAVDPWNALTRPSEVEDAVIITHALSLYLIDTMMNASDLNLPQELRAEYRDEAARIECVMKEFEEWTTTKR